MAKLLPARRAVDRRRFVQRRRHRLQASEQANRDERHAAPDIGCDRRAAREPRLTEEVDVAVDDAHLRQGPRDDRELRVVDPPERDRRQRGRHDERQQHDRTQERLERQMAVQQQREPQAEHELQDAGDDRVDKRVEQRQQRHRVLDQKRVVLPADPDTVTADLRVGEAEPGAEAEWIGEEHQQHHCPGLAAVEERRQNAGPGERLAHIVVDPLRWLLPGVLAGNAQDHRRPFQRLYRPRAAAANAAAGSMKSRPRKWRLSRRRCICTLFPWEREEEIRPCSTAPPVPLHAPPLPSASSTRSPLRPPCRRR